MQKFIFFLALFYSLNIMAQNPGEKAPEFALKGASGKVINSESFENQIVILEWLNHGCPFIRKHYDSGNMQALQKKYTALGVKWYSIISSAKGKQGHVNAWEAKNEAKKYGSLASDILLDPLGKVGRKYAAKTTPHMFVLQNGKIIYNGAIDSIPSADQADINKANNYIEDVMNYLLMGTKKKIDFKTKPYGCSVKY